MFKRDKKIRFLINDIHIEGIGRVYSGKEVVVKSDFAEKMVKFCHAEYVVEAPVLEPLKQEEEVKDGGISKPKSRKRAFKNRTK